MTTAAAQQPLTVENIIGMVLNLTSSLNRVADNQERLLAGQEKAIEKIEGTKAPTGRGRGAAAKKEEPAASETPAPETPKSFLPTDVTDEATLKTFVSAWTGAVEGDARQTRVNLLKAIAGNFGVEPKFGPLAADADRLKQTLFFIERSKAGKKVDFSADYDFDGDPAQDAAVRDTSVDDSDFG